jgi:hypothetical protein
MRVVGLEHAENLSELFGLSHVSENRARRHNVDQHLTVRGTGPTIGSSIHTGGEALSVFPIREGASSLLRACWEENW